MSVAGGLEGCPPEIVESITILLDVTDAGNLRLASRCLCSKVRHGIFRSYFRSKCVKVVGPELERLVAITQHGWLGCEISDLTLVGIVNDAKTFEANPENLPERLVHLLGNAFKNIAANGTFRKLRSLSLEVIVCSPDSKDELAPIDGGPQRPIWQTAAETARITFSALQGSNLEIESMNIFNRQLRCSIAGNELSRIDYHAKGLSKTLCSLKSLSISVSERMFDAELEAILTGDLDYDGATDDEGRALEEAARQACNDCNFTGLAGLIQACENITYLDILHRRVNLGYPLSRIPNERLFQRVAGLGTTLLPPLEECILRGVFLTEIDLSAFVKAAPFLRRLSIEAVTMVLGTFQSIFDYITSDISKLEYLYLEQLRTGSDMVHFTDAGHPKLYTWENANGSSTLKREGEDVRRPIQCHQLTDWLPVGSPNFRAWLRDQRRKYGPP
ncbi:F-box domain protein [Aspergillus lucknowensis]|uniref:F-box domain-containing protein n=1 Tax=Aspergillus lucknowensis TaxID=176173 RepID=A0ABR4LF76_9EURO